MYIPKTEDYIINGAELEKVYHSYLIMWKQLNKKGTPAFTSCPHLSYAQLNEWADKIIAGLKANNITIIVKTILTTALNVKGGFQKTF